MDDFVVLSALSGEWKYFSSTDAAEEFLYVNSIPAGKYLLLSGDEMLSLFEKIKAQKFEKILRGE